MTNSSGDVLIRAALSWMVVAALDLTRMCVSGTGGSSRSERVFAGTASR
jgi:hypothetical protein